MALTHITARPVILSEAKNLNNTVNLIIKQIVI